MGEDQTLGQCDWSWGPTEGSPARQGLAPSEVFSSVLFLRAPAQLWRNRTSCGFGEEALASVALLSPETKGRL